MEKLCEKWATREQCKKTCTAVNTILWKDNRVMERHYSDCIMCFPKRGKVHFSELQEQQIDQFSNADVVPWSSEDLRLKKTAVFVERFFNKVSCRELARPFRRQRKYHCLHVQAGCGIH